MSELLPQFKNTQEELEFLRSRIAAQESLLRTQQIREAGDTQGIERMREQVAHQMVDAYKRQEPEKILHHSAQVSHQEVAAISLNLAPEAHDAQIEGLYALMLDKGVLNTLKIVENIGNPHLTDDFHRFLVQYLVATQSVPGVQKNSELYSELDATLYEVTLPEPEEGKTRNFKEVIATMDQMLYGLQSIGQIDNKSKHWYTLELAVPSRRHSCVVLCLCPECGS
jgi:hypothetical protein